MTKEGWVALIIDNVSGGATPADMDSRLHPLIVSELFSMVYSEVIYGIYTNAMTYRDFGQLDAYVKTYTVDVSKDSDRNEFYSVLPASILNLPHDRGIKLISPLKSQKDSFKQITLDSADMWNELEAGVLASFNTFYREGTKIFYGGNYDENITKVLMKLLVPFSEFDDDEELGIPAQMSAKVFAMVKELLEKRAPEKVSNNNDSK